MTHGGLQVAIDRLYAVPLEAFVAERTRLARELRAGGDRSSAEEVAKLPKPTAAAWALNHIAREQPDAVEQWLRATATLRDASTHAADVGGDALRAAMAAHRTATASLLDAVRERAQPGGRALSEAMLDRVRTLLQSATVDSRVAGRLRAGRVTEEKAATEAAPEPQPQRRRAAPKSPRGSQEGAAAARAARAADLERRARAAEKRLQRLRNEAARREAATHAVDARLEKARRALDRCESQAAAAHDAAKDAEGAAAAAEHDLRQVQALLRDASARR